VFRLFFLVSGMINLLQPSTLILLNLCLAALLSGLIWTIQLVHYPSFLDVGTEEYLVYQRNHMRNISYLVIPLMLLELGFGAYLQIQHHISPIHWTISLSSALLGLIWITTFVVSSPLHGQLVAVGYDREIIRKLINTNWIRTFAWTFRFLIFFWLMLKGQ